MIAASLREFVDRLPPTALRRADGAAVARPARYADSNAITRRAARWATAIG
jgi:hypothetical protein